MIHDEVHTASLAKGKESSQRPKNWSVEHEKRAENFALIGGVLLMGVIFVLDILTGKEIRLHVLYLFPLAWIARIYPPSWATIAALLLSTLLQIITFAHQTVAVASFITDVIVALAASGLTAYLAMNTRTDYLTATMEAATDALTRLLNRGAFISVLNREMTRQRRYPSVFSIAMLDLDGFKKVNDSMGHAAGDEVLIQVAALLRTYTRGTDTVGRYGGDEFAILMPNTDEAQCGILIEKLCASIAGDMRERGFAVTASIGSKTFREPPVDSLQALKQADFVLYQAKYQGKNRALQG